MTRLRRTVRTATPSSAARGTEVFYYRQPIAMGRTAGNIMDGVTGRRISLPSAAKEPDKSRHWGRRRPGCR